MQEKIEKDRADASNAVESYVYMMREKLSDVYEQYMQPEVSFMIQLAYFVGPLIVMSKLESEGGKPFFYTKAVVAQERTGTERNERNG